jgi:hypothetical protein
MPEEPSTFDKENAKVNEEKNASRERVIQTKTRGTKNADKPARIRERRLFRKKARQLDEDALIEIEQHRSIQDSRKFYKRLNDESAGKMERTLERRLRIGATNTSSRFER